MIVGAGAEALIDRADSHLSIARQCQLLKVARSTLYYRPHSVSDDDLAVMRRLPVMAHMSARDRQQSVERLLGLGWRRHLGCKTDTEVISKRPTSSDANSTLYSDN
jgi:hypothetical protein